MNRGTETAFREKGTETATAKRNGRAVIIAHVSV